MCRTTRCQLFLILSILVVSSAPAAVAAEALCAATTYLPPVGTRAVLDGFDTQAAVSRPQDVDPARSQLRPTSCGNDPIQFQTAAHDEMSYISCADAASKVAADADADANNGCCNLGGSVSWESIVYAACNGCNGAWCAHGWKYYKCTVCNPPIC